MAIYKFLHIIFVYSYFECQNWCPNPVFHALVLMRHIKAIKLDWSNIADDGNGSLRMACKSTKPLWIVFDVSGVIMLSSAIKVQSFKTIDGRGQRVKLMGNGLQLRECEHVIICNLEFEGGRGHDVDGIQLKPNSKHVWIDRCSLSDYDDGLIDITRQCTDITVSRWPLQLFSYGTKVMPVGSFVIHFVLEM